MRGRSHTPLLALLPTQRRGAHPILAAGWRAAFWSGRFRSRRARSRRWHPRDRPGADASAGGTPSSPAASVGSRRSPSSAPPRAPRGMVPRPGPSATLDIRQIRPRHSTPESTMSTPSANTSSKRSPGSWLATPAPPSWRTGSTCAIGSPGSTPPASTSSRRNGPTSSCTTAGASPRARQRRRSAGDCQRSAASAGTAPKNV